MTRAAVAALAAALGAAVLAGCGYDPPTTRHQVMNAMPQPHERRFAVVVLTTESHEPRGFTHWLRRGRPKVDWQMARLWICDAETGGARMMARIARPKPLRSEYAAWIVGWDSVGTYPSIYLDVRGREGWSPKSKLLRYLLKVEVDPDTSRAVAVAFVPSTAASVPPIAPLHGGRELQVSAGDTIRVRTDLDPEWRPRFRVDPASGSVAAISSPLSAGDSKD